MAGFDLDSPLVCEGIIGDGCGGGRIFFVEDASLKTYDPVTKERQTLLSNLVGILNISKSGCNISLVSKSEEIVFNLSTLLVV